MLCMLGKNFSKETICKKCQSLFSGKKKKKNGVNLSSSDLTQRMIKVNIFGHCNTILLYNPKGSVCLESVLFAI